MLRIARIVGLLALSGCDFIRTYTLDSKAADAYRAKYLPECRQESDPAYAELIEDKAKSASVSEAVIRAVLTKNYGDISACYTETNDIWPELGGRLVLKFVVRPHGNVGEVSIAETDIPIRALVCCIIGKLRMWTFPPPVGGGAALGTASYRFRRETMQID